MDLASLATRLKGDLRRSPGKAAILGILVLVALWFWAPLLWKWGGQDRDSKTNELAATATTPTVAGTPAAQAESQGAAETKKAPKRPSWNDLLSAIERDGRMRSAMLDDGFLSPFRRDAPKLDEEETDETKNETKPQDMHPSRFGLVLTSTLVGPRSRLATIKGETYRQGDTIAVGRIAADGGWEADTGDSENDVNTHASGSQPTGKKIEFRLETIQPDHVILTHQTKSYRLELQRRVLAGRVRPVRETARQVN